MGDELGKAIARATDWRDYVAGFVGGAAGLFSSSFTGVDPLTSAGGGALAAVSARQTWEGVRRRQKLRKEAENTLAFFEEVNASSYFRRLKTLIKMFELGAIPVNEFAAALVKMRIEYLENDRLD